MPTTGARRSKRLRRQVQAWGSFANNVSFDGALGATAATFSYTNYGNCILVSCCTSGATNSVTGVTYGGVALNFLGFQEAGTFAAGGVAVYGLISATLPQGANNVVVTGFNIWAGANSYKNAGSFGAVQTTSSSGAGTVSSGSLGIPSTHLGGYSFAASSFGSSGTVVVTSSANILRWNEQIGGSGGTGASGNGWAIDAPSVGGGATTTLSWSDGGPDAMAMVGVEVLPVTPISITTSSLPAGFTGIPYSQTLAASGGAGGNTWTVIAGSLPGWATLSSGGVLSGTPTSSGSSTFTVQVQDSLGQTATQSLTLNWAAKPYIASLSSGSGVARHFLDQNSNVILWASDSPWGLFHNAGRWSSGNVSGDFTNYCSIRSGQGFTVMYIHAMGHTHTGGVTDDGATWDGIKPFTVNGTAATLTGQVGTVALNSSFWSRMDTLVTTAQTYGMLVLIDYSHTCDLPVGSSHGFTNGAFFNASTTQMTAAATAIASRYASSPNIAHFFGDDYFDDDDTAMDALYNGAVAGDSRVSSFTSEERTPNGADCHYGYATAPGVGGNNPPATLVSVHATWNHVYNYQQTYFGVEYSYTEPSPLPVVYGDGNYYGETANPQDVSRRQLWWALSSGARGVQAGDTNVWNWQTGAAAALTGDVIYTNVIPAIFSTFASLTGWQNLVPDTGSVLVTAGRGTRATYTATEYAGAADTYVTASMTPDHSLAVIYCASAMSITIDQTQLSAGYTAEWIDPASGAITSTTTGSTYSSSGLGNNSIGEADWVLVLQGAPIGVNHPGTATLTGSGTLTETVTLGFSAGLSGSGTLSENVTLGFSTTLSGSGTMTESVTLGFSSTLSGSGTLTALASVTLLESATLSGSGSLTANPTLGYSTGLSGSGTLSGQVTLGYSAGLSGSGTLSENVILGYSAGLSGSGTLSETVVLGYSATLSGSGTLSEQVTLGYSSTLSGSGTLAEQVTLGYSSTLSGSGSLTASGGFGGQHPGVATLSGSGTITESVTLGFSVGLSGSGTLTESVILGYSSTLSGSGSITAGATLGYQALLSGSGSISENVALGYSSTLTGSGALTSTATIAFLVSAALSGIGTITATATHTGGTPLPGGLYTAVVGAQLWSANLLSVARWASEITSVWEADLTNLWEAAMATANIYQVSQQNVAINVWGPTGVNLSAFTVQGNFLLQPPSQQEPSSGWIAATWGTTPAPGPPPYLALVPMTGLAVGTYYVWLKINSTGTGEVPVLFAGDVFIQ